MRPRRHQTFVTGPSRTIPSASRKTASSAPRRLRLGLGRHVDRVARRLDAGQEPGRVGADASQGDQPWPRSRSASRWSGSALTSASAVGCRRRARRPEEPQDGVRLAGRLERLGGAPRAAARSPAAGRSVPPTSQAVRGARPAGTACPSRRGASRTRRGRGAAPRRRRAAPARPGRRGRGRRPRARARLTASPPRSARRSRRAAGRAFVHDSSISASGSESQTTPPPTQRWIRPSATAKVRIVSARSRSPLPRTRRARPSRRRGRPARARRSGRRRRSSGRP